MDNFENWFKRINEELAAETTNTEISGRSDIMVDVDTIMNSLETLASELKEELVLEEETSVSEGAKDFIKQWITSLKAVSSQKKVNKVRMNSADLEFAANKFDGDKKKSMKEKSDQVSKQATELQKMVNDKFSGKGDIVDRKLSAAKIKGQLEIIKRTSGMEQNPNKKASLKMKMKELTAKFAEEQQAISSLEKDNEGDIKAEKERIAAEKAKKAEGQPKAEPKSEEPKSEEPKAEPKAEPKSEEPKSEPKAEEPKAEEPKAEPKAEEPKEEPKEEDTEEEKKKEVNDSLVIRAKAAGLNELATEIESKLDWQIAEGTTLYNKYLSVIKKEESNKILNESRYQINSVKDAFSRLM